MKGNWNLEQQNVIYTQWYSGRYLTTALQKSKNPDLQYLLISKALNYDWFQVSKESSLNTEWGRVTTYCYVLFPTIQIQ